jgi:glycosyltransferase involved in cell wall biosynthesis
MISVVVPVRNEEEHLGDCLQALQRQTLPAERYEIIVVDDGSKDGSAGIAEAAGVRAIRQESRGASVARNRGVREAGGDIVLLVDADCVVPPDWIEKLTAPILAGQADVTVGRYDSDQKNWVAGLVQVEIQQRYDRMIRHRQVDFVNSGCSAFRRRVLLDNPFDETYRKALEDVELSFRLAEKGVRMLFMPELAVKHSHPTRFRDLLRRKFYYAAHVFPVYRKYPRKTLGDASTPQKRRLQLVLMGLAPLLAPFSLVASAVCLALWAVLSIPFIASAFRKSFKLGLLAPIFALVGNAVFVVGTVWGMISNRAR